MNNEVLKGEWKELKGKIREWWGDLTDDEVEKIDGNRERLEGALQKKYGYAKAKAKSEIDRVIDEYRNSTRSRVGH